MLGNQSKQAAGITKLSSLLLDTSPEQLRFGRSSEKTLIAKFGNGLSEVANVDQQFFRRYLALTESQRRMVRDVVGEFKTAGVV